MSSRSYSLRERVKIKIKIVRHFLDEHFSFQQGLESMMPKVASKISSEVGCSSSVNTHHKSPTRVYTVLITPSGEYR